MFDKELMIDTKGAPITQGLFLETSYGNTDNVLYTLKSRDHEYRGRVLPSIKRLYLEMEDETEYNFANEYFLDWDHWKRIRANKLIDKHMKGWKDEMEVRQRCNYLADLKEQSLNGKTAATQQLLKELKDRGPGRPSKVEIEREAKIHARVMDEFADDLARMRR